ncbi:hypothetical protein OV208_23165 [Corallococcus sp. bb12-1]|uniref:hypothetical protein n=1 Tax=Corallococcus sp. bb12-1 TaxID=2996784 RepID=UPI0022708C5D|nr:hypothetical protein [Corallococcus sp. bb12-1]MCY1044238.1 hypothetical protein [Corallococcus sp. bb12-1]
MSERSSWVARIVGGLLCLAVLGGLMGAALEGVIYRDAPTPLEKVQAKADLELAQPPPSGRRSAADEAILARALVHFPPYPNASSRPEALAADYLGPDVPIAVAWFSTQDPPQKVLLHYRQVLRDAGLPVLGHEFSAYGGYVGYWSPATKEMRMVSVLYQGGETLVFVSAGEVAKALESQSAPPRWVPLPAGADKPQVITLQLEGVTQFLVAGESPTGSMAEVEADWRRAMAAKGWEAGPSSEAGPNALGFEVGHDGLNGQALLKQSSSEGVVEFNLSVMRRLKSAP